MSASTQSSEHLYIVHRVPLTRPLVWLSRGWEDLTDHPSASLSYGLLVSVMGAIILGLERHPYFIAAAISGFMLVGPIMTAGLCELSRLNQSGELANFDASLKALKRHRGALGRFAQTLLLASIIWYLLSTMLLTAWLGSVGPELSQTMWGDVLRNLSATQLLSYLAIGAALSGTVFALSIVTVPMIIDTHAEAGAAMNTSLRVTWQDLPAVLLWAATIVFLVGLGFATYLVGMVVIFPLLGHATWYAYRDLVEDTAEELLEDNKQE